MPGRRAGQHTLGELGPPSQVIQVIGDRGEAVAHSLSPAIPGSFGYVLKGGNGCLEDGGERRQGAFCSGGHGGR